MRISLKKRHNIILENFKCLSKEVKLTDDNIKEYLSNIEFEFIYLLEYDIKVNIYIQKPFTINSKKEENQYTPSFYVEYIDGQKELIDIVYTKEIYFYKNHPTNPLIREICTFNKITYKILTPEDIKTPFLDNVKFLLKYKRLPPNVKKEGVFTIIKILTKGKNIKIIDLIEKITPEINKQAEYLYLLWYIVANNFVDFNNQLPLTMDTVLQIKSHGKIVYK